MTNKQRISILEVRGRRQQPGKSTSLQAITDCAEVALRLSFKPSLPVLSRLSSAFSALIPSTKPENPGSQLSLPSKHVSNDGSTIRTWLVTGCLVLLSGRKPNGFSIKSMHCYPLNDIFHWSLQRGGCVNFNADGIWSMQTSWCDIWFWWRFGGK